MQYYRTQPRLASGGMYNYKWRVQTLCDKVVIRTQTCRQKFNVPAAGRNFGVRMPSIGPPCAINIHFQVCRVNAGLMPNHWLFHQGGQDTYCNCPKPRILLYAASTKWDIVLHHKTATWTPLALRPSAWRIRTSRVKVKTI